MFESRMQRTALLVAAGGLCLVVLAQSLAGLTAVGSDGTATGRALGEAGFVYLTGFRSTLAGILWKRVDEQGDQFYEGVDFATQSYMLPTVRIVTMLDPHYVEPYFVGQWVIAHQGQRRQALAMTREGLANNPDSGVLRSSMAQLLDTFFDHDPRAYQWALKTIAPDSKWRSTEEKFAAWAVARDMFKRYGDQASYVKAVAELKALMRPGAALSPSEKAVSGK